MACQRRLLLARPASAYRLGTEGSSWLIYSCSNTSIEQSPAGMERRSIPANAHLDMKKSLPTSEPCLEHGSSDLGTSRGPHIHLGFDIPPSISSNEWQTTPTNRPREDRSCRSFAQLLSMIGVKRATLQQCRLGLQHVRDFVVVQFFDGDLSNPGEGCLERCFVVALTSQGVVAVIRR
jgi:hypothetical protein